MWGDVAPATEGSGPEGLAPQRVGERASPLAEAFPPLFCSFGVGHKQPGDQAERRQPHDDEHGAGQPAHAAAQQPPHSVEPPDAINAPVDAADNGKQKQNLFETRHGWTLLTGEYAHPTAALCKNTLQEKANLYIINLKDSAKGENQMLGLYLAAMDDSTYETQFVQVYERCKRLVYHTAYQIVQDSYLAEDVLQEVFLHLAQNFTRVYREDKHKMAAYLVICTKSRAIDMLRKRKGAAEDGDGTEYENFADDAPLPEDVLIGAEVAQRLMQLVQELPLLYREPLQLKALGYGNAEIASALDLTESTVRQRIVRGRKILWRKLHDGKE